MWKERSLELSITAILKTHSGSFPVWLSTTSCRWSFLFLFYATTKKKSAAWKCRFSQRHSNKEGIKRTSVPCANKTLICTASTLQTLSAILLPGTRVGVRGVTLEHFQPLFTELSLSPSHGAACTADHWLGHGVSKTRLKIVLFCFLTRCILTWVTRRQKDTAALLPDHNFLTCSGRQ